MNFPNIQPNIKLNKLRSIPSILFIYHQLMCYSIQHEKKKKTVHTDK